MSLQVFKKSAAQQSSNRFLGTPICLGPIILLTYSVFSSVNWNAWLPLMYFASCSYEWNMCQWITLRADTFAAMQLCSYRHFSGIDIIMYMPRLPMVLIAQCFWFNVKQVQECETQLHLHYGACLLHISLRCNLFSSLCLLHNFLQMNMAPSGHA